MAEFSMRWPSSPEDWWCVAVHIGRDQIRTQVKMLGYLFMLFYSCFYFETPNLENTTRKKQVHRKNWWDVEMTRKDQSNYHGDLTLIRSNNKIIRVRNQLRRDKESYKTRGNNRAEKKKLFALFGIIIYKRISVIFSSHITCLKKSIWVFKL